MGKVPYIGEPIALEDWGRRRAGGGKMTESIYPNERRVPRDGLPRVRGNPRLSTSSMYDVHFQTHFLVCLRSRPRLALLVDYTT